ncbi:MAG: hypothetical protein J5822_04340 [Eubacteriaceae bacterium]|nr:hypothetical protein [Eubacteriaceae bacterium]
MHEGKHGITDPFDDALELFSDDGEATGSKKKGCIVLKKNNYLKVTYSHRSSEMQYLGEKVADWVRSAGAAAISDYFDKVEVVREEDGMSPEQRESYRKYIPSQLWKEDMSWYEALAWTKDACAPLRDGYPWLVDYSGFNGAWVNRWRYIIDLDNNEFIVVLAGLEMMCHPTDTYEKDFIWPDKVAHTEVGRFPLDDIPSDWAEQCRRRFGSLMIVAVDYSRNREAVHSDNIQHEGEGLGGYNPYDTDWENIKFYYGQNSYDEIMNDME